MRRLGAWTGVTLGSISICIFANEWLYTLFGMDTWPVFPLISYSALHAAIFLNMASNDDMVARISAAVCNALRNSQQQVRVKGDS